MTTINKVNHFVLWTGGWDSTYRIVELSRKEVVIQPIYVFGDKRISEKNEVKSMDTILQKLRNKKETRATILPVSFIDKKQIEFNAEISNAYKVIQNETQLGTQHEWLAFLANKMPGLEIGTESAPLDLSKVLNSIEKYCKLIYDNNIDMYVVDKKQSSKEGTLVLGNLRFPIIELSGPDMRNNIRMWGYEEIMKHIWVCHRPIFGEACGFCHPCQLKMETKMEWLFNKRTINRYNKRKRFYFKIFRRARDIYYRIKRIFM